MMDEKKGTGENMFNLVEDYELLLENLRTRLNILNTSIFLLEDNLRQPDNESVKTDSHFDRINKELDRIRRLIIEGPESFSRPG